MRNISVKLFKILILQLMNCFGNHYLKLFFKFPRSCHDKMYILNFYIIILSGLKHFHMRSCLPVALFKVWYLLNENFDIKHYTRASLKQSWCLSA